VLVPNPVTVADIANRWRPLTSAEEIVVQARLNDAWELILAKVPDVEARLLAGTLRPGLLLVVEAEMVLPAAKNSDGGTETEFKIDDFSKRIRFESASKPMELTDAQIEMLSPPAPAGAGTEGAWTIRPYSIPVQRCGDYW
jgi:hypothetical protein